MADIWQTIEQAAVTLGLSVRTVNRHITAGKLESRLFEGRREVRIPANQVPPTDNLVNPTTAVSSDRPVARDRQSSASQSGPARREPVATSNSPVDVTARATDTTDNAAASPPETPASSATPNFVFADSAARESVGRRPMSDFGGAQPTDLQTMLALADSLDDKATLAVAAYQTLARSSELQVQGLRRVAWGAWATVGVMAAGLIIGVGWGATRLTSAEVTVHHLQDRLEESTKRASELAEERRLERDRLASAAELQGRNAELLRQNQELRLDHAQLSAAVIHSSRPTTHPSAVKAEDGSLRATSTTQPSSTSATQPANNRTVAGSPAAAGSPAPAAPVSTPVGGGAVTPGATSGVRPATHPAGKPGLPQSPRPTYMTNSQEAFDGR